MAKRTYSVTLADGKSFTRKSERKYTHAVVVRFAHETFERVWGFCGSLDLAEKLHRTASGRAAECRIAPVEIVSEQTGLLRLKRDLANLVGL